MPLSIHIVNDIDQISASIKLVSEKKYVPSSVSIKKTASPNSSLNAFIGYKIEFMMPEGNR